MWGGGGEKEVQKGLSSSLCGRGWWGRGGTKKGFAQGVTDGGMGEGGLWSVGQLLNRR